MNHTINRAASAVTNVDIFPTDLGWFVLAGTETQVARLSIGLPSELAGENLIAADPELSAARRGRWSLDLVQRLQQFAAGHPVEFFDLEISLVTTPFRETIYDELRQIPFGETISYAELAARAGRPKAARAIGSAMAANPLPIIIPCHRVVGSGQHLGGFSAPGGIDFKRRMLALEAAGVRQPLTV